MVARPRLIAAVAIGVIGMVSIGAGLYYRAQRAELEAAQLALIDAEVLLADIETQAKGMASVEQKHFMAVRQFDQTIDGKGMYEAVEVNARGWPVEKCVLVASDSAVRPFGQQKKLSVVDGGSKAVKMTNSNAYRTWETTEYFKHWLVVTADDHVAMDEKLKGAMARVADARQRRDGALFFWESPPSGDFVPSSGLAPPPPPPTPEPAAGPRPGRALLSGTAPVAITEGGPDEVRNALKAAKLEACAVNAAEYFAAGQEAGAALAAGRKPASKPPTTFCAPVKSESGTATFTIDVAPGEYLVELRANGRPLGCEAGEGGESGDLFTVAAGEVVKRVSITSCM